MVAIHSKGAERDVLDCFDRLWPVRASLHRYQGPAGGSRELIDRGALVSIGFPVPDSPAVRDRGRRLPLSELSTGTDNPAGRPLRRSEAMPDLVCEVLREIARLTGVEARHLVEVVAGNLRRLLGVQLAARLDRARGESRVPRDTPPAPWGCAGGDMVIALESRGLPAFKPPSLLTFQPKGASPMSNLRDALVAEIRRIVREHPANRLPGTDEPIFDDPLVGFAAADDPIFSKYKEIIGPFHWSPQEALGAGAGGRTRTVISWILPITEATRRENRAETRLPSRRWAHTRWHGEAFNEQLRRGVVGFLEARGHAAAAPCLAETWKVVDDPRVGLASTWSERHAAFAAGLGTFSLNDALITERGIAHRAGSVVTTAEIPPTPRTAAHHRANCAFYAPAGCGVCIGRCPAGALSEEGHDKERCRGYTYGRVMDEVGERYGVKVAGCGLCQTKVPCESRTPPAAREG
ncbi:MAG: hypothetical protein Kow0092_24310 [Deferrisomatales bacterium]